MLPESVPDEPERTKLLPKPFALVPPDRLFYRQVKVGVMGRLSPRVQSAVDSMAAPVDDKSETKSNGQALAAAVADLSKQNGVASH